MAILSDRQLLKPFIKKAAGYVKALISSEHVELNDGTTLQETLDLVNKNTNFQRYNSGIWHIKKYNNGDAECWCSYQTVLTNYSTVLSGYGVYSASLDLPIQFIETPIKIYNTQVGNGIAFASSATSNDSKTQIYFYATANNTGSQTCIFNVHVLGQWK